jgi:hypothetical protein
LVFGAALGGEKEKEEKQKQNKRMSEKDELEEKEENKESITFRSFKPSSTAVLTFSASSSFENYPRENGMKRLLPTPERKRAKKRAMMMTRHTPSLSERHRNHSKSNRLRPSCSSIQDHCQD